MSAKYLLSPQAVADLEQAIDYYLEHAGPDVAARLIDDLEHAFRLLAENPNIGHRRDDLTSEPIRFWRVHAYLIAYQAESSPVAIGRILHTARDARALLDP